MKMFFILMAIAAVVLGVHGFGGFLSTGHLWGEILRMDAAWQGDASDGFHPSQKDYAQYPNKVAQDYAHAVRLGKATANTLGRTGLDVFFLAALLFLTSIMGWRSASNKSVQPTANCSAARDGSP